MRGLLAVALVAIASGRELQPRKDAAADADQGIDHYAQIRVRPKTTFVAAGVATVAATALQVVKPAWLQHTFGSTCSQGLGAVFLKCVTFVDEMKVSNPLGLTMGHGIILKAIAEVLAQVIPQRAAATAWIDPLRIVRSSIASLLSSSLTFYYWTRLSFVRTLAAPRWLQALAGQRLGVALTKMVVTQVVYRPANVFFFLLAQSFFRGDSARELVKLLRTRFKAGLIGGIAFFAISNMLMFSVPVPFLHPIIGALAGLIFNVWLAMVAYKKAPAPTRAAPPEASTAIANYPTTTAVLGTVGLVESLAAAAMYSHYTRRSTMKPVSVMDVINVPRAPFAADAM